MKLRATHEAVIEGRTVHTGALVDPLDYPPLKSGKHNKKIGGEVTRGPWAGMPIYTLTLQERATCPRSCEFWRSCYGNNMMFAHRQDHRDPKKLMGAIGRQLEALTDKHPDGYVVRLHILGDFFSVEYTDTWRAWLRYHKPLHIFGYTHRRPSSEDAEDRAIASVIRHMNMFRERCLIRFSDQEPHDGLHMVANGITDASERLPGFTICPNQLKPDINCGSCGLCWNRDQQIHFIEH